MIPVDPATMTRAELIEARSESARQAELCNMASCFARGRRSQQLQQWARQHMANAHALDDALHPGEHPSAMLTDDELLAVLLA